MCFLIHWTKVTNPQDQRLRQRFVEDTVPESRKATVPEKIYYIFNSL